MGGSEASVHGNRPQILPPVAQPAVPWLLPFHPASRRRLPCRPIIGRAPFATSRHIVILMQENRSFDHYFGSLRGVRGFGDPRAVQLSTGQSVWHQPDGKDGYVLPFHPPAPDMGLQFLEDLAHDWNTTQHAWNKGPSRCLGPHQGSYHHGAPHAQRYPIPLRPGRRLHRVRRLPLFAAWPPPDPNRYHMWTGWVGNDGLGGGPVVNKPTKQAMAGPPTPSCLKRPESHGSSTRTWALA